MARKSRKQAVLTDSGQAFKITDYRVAVYIRLSVEDNKKRGDSVESQRCIIENYVALNPDFEIVDTYIDNGTTGTNFEREGFKRMLGDIDSGKVNCIIVKDLSRLGRNVIDTGYYMEKYFPAKNVRFIAVNDNYDSNDTDSVHGGIIIPLKNMINEAYALDQSRKIREQQRQAMLAGQYVGAKPPYGYLKHPDDCHKLIVDKEAAPVVQQIFEWFLDGTSVNHIVRRLNEAEELTPSYHLFKLGVITNKNILGNGSWQTNVITTILRREAYVGDMVQGKRKNANRKSLGSKPESEWISVSDTHEAIISREDFAKAQERLKFLADRHHAKPKKTYSPNYFKGKVFCGHCGGSMNRHRKHTTKKGDVYWFCCLSNERKARGSCEGASLRENVMTDKLIAAASVHADDVRSEAQSLREYERNQAVNDKITSHKSEINKCRQFSKQLHESNVNGLITNDEYNEMRLGYERKIKECTDSILRLETYQREFDKQVAEYCEMADFIASENTDIAEFVARLVDKIMFFSDKHIEVEFSFNREFDLLSEVNV